MHTIEDIYAIVHPIPKSITALPDAPLHLSSITRFAIHYPKADNGPVKTAHTMLTQFLVAHFGETCFSEDGIPLVFSIAHPPTEPTCTKEGYRIQVRSDGIDITGFSDQGLFYGVISLLQILSLQQLPAFSLLDWPDDRIRGYIQESRWGSNVMEKEEWFALIDDIAAKKLNQLNVTLYCCWNVQYDGRVAEYLYFPVKGYPQLQTPMRVKYYSPAQNKWIEEEILPPIFRNDFFGELIQYGKDRCVDVVPCINSFGHNTYLPRTVPEVSPLDAEGNPTNTGFCTSIEETYRLLFHMYDQLIDNYLIPNGIRTFSIGLDEVRAEYATDPNNPATAPSPWCQCPVCQQKSKQDIFVNHAIRLIRHLKEKGITTVCIYYDMLIDHPKGIGDVAEKFHKAVFDNDLQDVLLCMWWYYYDTTHRLRFFDCHDELNLRSTTNPWNGYYNWCFLTNCTKNVKLMADMKHNSNHAEGMYLYSMWDKSADRIHDYFADLGWNYLTAGTTEETTRRYAARHFKPLEEDARHAFHLMDLCTEQRREYKGPDIDADKRILSNYDILYRLCYYPFSYFSHKQPYPRHFPGEGLSAILPMREDVERQLYAISAMAKEAKAFFEKASVTNGCDDIMAKRLAYECENYQCISEDWIAFLKIYDLKKIDAYKEIAHLARKRQQARLKLMSTCEQVKEEFVLRGAAMRELSIFMQTFADIAKYIESATVPALDIFDISDITSTELRNIR